tara:strand:+ start:40 stop:708 length:669 start_codon:yes stop_codon:yes gene_type:complete
MKTYNQFITELNKVELAIKAGKLGVKALRRLRLKPSSIMSPNRKVPVYDILKLRNSPRSPIVSKRKQIENIMKASKNPDDIYFTNKGQMGLLRSQKGSSRFAGTELDTAVRHKSLRGRSKAVVRQDQKKRDAKTSLSKAGGSFGKGQLDVFTMKPPSRFVKPDQTRQLSDTPANDIIKHYHPSYPRTKAPTGYKDTKNPNDSIFKITTKTPKKGSIPEPPKK